MENLSTARTQEGIIFPVTARLLDENENVVDTETIVLPDPNQSPVSIAGGAGNGIDFRISNLVFR